jgi:hypothetical protein
VEKMKQRIFNYLLINGYNSNYVTAHYLLAIISKPRDQTVTNLCDKLGINRSYYYKLFKKHRDFIQMIKSEKNENEKTENKKAR